MSSLIPVIMIDIFVYGSLMFDSVRDMLINTRYQALYARIDGYRRLSVKGEVYPGLIESAGDPVNGVLLLGISNTILPVLDQFEGDYYRRQSVTVMVPDNGVFWNAPWVRSSNRGVTCGKAYK